ncbi:hypothetical protein [Myxococcus stipitatus]|uniref:hypothetical protein n=1 Tax=Myxococcus stipitatus TaxID=83455 RepID=UPI0030CFD784
MPTSPWLVSRARWCLASSRLGMALVLLSSTAAFAQTTYRPEARTVFASCRPQAPSTVERIYLCPGLAATIAWVVAPPGFTDARMLEHFRSGISATTAGVVESKLAKLRLAGVERDGLEYLVRETEGGTVVGKGSATLVRQGEGVWYLSCVVEASAPGAAKRCRQILEFFAIHGVPEPIDLKSQAQAAKPVLGTRELVVPRGCTATGPVDAGKIQCPSSFLSWMVVPQLPNMKKFRDENLASQRKTYEAIAATKGSVLTEKEVDCRVMGEPRTCTQFLIPIGESRFRVLSGVKSQEAQMVQLICAQMDQTEEFPAVCNGLMEILPPAPPAAGPEEKAPPARRK